MAEQTGIFSVNIRYGRKGGAVGKMAHITPPVFRGLFTAAGTGCGGPTQSLHPQ